MPPKIAHSIRILMFQRTSWLGVRYDIGSSELDDDYFSFREIMQIGVTQSSSELPISWYQRFCADLSSRLVECPGWRCGAMAVVVQLSVHSTVTGRLVHARQGERLLLRVVATHQTGVVTLISNLLILLLWKKIYYSQVHVQVTVWLLSTQT